MKELHIVTDLQYGSTGKGLLAGYLAKKLQPDTLVCAWSPNAGHTFIDENGKKYVNTAIPNGIVADSVKRVLIGPGAVINPDTLLREMEQYAVELFGVDVMIHENAAVVTQRHREEESRGMFKIGSTMKGVGAAVIEKIQRNPASNIIARDALVSTPLEGYVVSADQYNRALDRSEVVLLEGAQGFSLSINQGFYPFTTSRDCTATQLMSDCAIPLSIFQYGACEKKVYGCARTYPIRVANRFDENGRMIGTSGPCYEDQREIAWEQLGMAPELTTVTKLPRRIFTFSETQIREAIRMNGVDEVFLNFVNYIDADMDDNKYMLFDYLNMIIGAGSRLTLIGTGPTELDIKEI